MIPCPGCQRHIRETESKCPFCQREQRSAGWVAGLAFVGLCAISSCSSDPASDDEAGTTTSQEGSTSTDETTTTSDSDSTESIGSEVTDTDDTVDGLEDAGLSFYAGATPDWGQVSACDTWAQDCPEGEKCVPSSSTGQWWDDTKCVPILGDGEPGDPCISDGNMDATDDCNGDSICWNAIEVDGQLVGQCAALCGGTPDEPECAPETECVFGKFGVLTICGPTCLPLNDDCSEGLVCTFMGNGMQCVIPGDVSLAEPCIEYQDCEAGSACMPQELVPGCEGPTCCAAFCDLGDPQCAMPGTECTSFFEEGMVPPPADQQGICIAP
jgi:hypothetical protein